MEYANILLPAFSLGGVFVGGFLQYIFGRSLESRKQLALQRGQAYVDYFKAVALLAQGNEKQDARTQAAEAKVRICLYGSEDVVEKLRKFEDSGAITNSPEAMNAIVELVLSMRRDVGMEITAINGESIMKVIFGFK